MYKNSDTCNTDQQNCKRYNSGVYNPQAQPAYLQPTLTVQQYLRRISQFYPVPLIIDDGIYGEETATAVSAFQKLVELPQTGEVDLLTWQMLLAVYENIENNYGTAVAIQPLKNMSDIENIDQDALVYFAQVMLKMLAKTYKNLKDIPISGIFDQQTATEIKKIQKICQLEPTGNMDLPTWNALTKIYNL